MSDLPFSFNDVYEPVYIKNSEDLKERWLKVTQEDFVPADNRKVSEMITDPLLQ